MPYRLGVIPAAGNATRWNNRSLHEFLKDSRPYEPDPVLKELLPLDGGSTLIGHTIDALDKVCAAILVVTNPDKLDPLSDYLSETHPNVPIFYTMQRGSLDMWSAMKTALMWKADQYFMAMPDTTYPVDTFLNAPRMEPEANFAMGCFWTRSPERFGMLRGLRESARIINKPHVGGPGWAWGTLTWSHDCAWKWLNKGLRNYTDAINYAIEVYGLHTWEMGHYFDFADKTEYDRYHQSISKGEIPQP